MPFGPQPLIEDNSVKAPASSTVNARFGWKNRRWEFALNLLNALNRKNDHIAYFYTSVCKANPPPDSPICTSIRRNRGSCA